MAQAPIAVFCLGTESARSLEGVTGRVVVGSIPWSKRIHAGNVPERIERPCVARLWRRGFVKGAAAVGALAASGAVPARNPRTTAAQPGDLRQHPRMQFRVRIDANRGLLR
jgi:hypothetical protein